MIKSSPYMRQWTDGMKINLKLLVIKKVKDSLR